jgi:23S rRNA pseudouridine1911/1915/1917 synthase
MEKRLGIKLYPVHRLDKETSGVILFAKSPDITSRIQKNFFKIKKTYIAIVYGAFPEKEFAVDVPIGYDPASTVKKMRIASLDAKDSARTRFKRIFSFGNYSLVKAFPETGRLHQIRVHLKYAGYPILGDKLYGLDPDYFLRFIREGMSEGLLEKLEFPRSALHSRSLCFYHPELKKEILVRAPVPEDFRTFIQARRITPCQKR